MKWIPQTKPCRARVDLHDATKGLLSSWGHRVSLVQDDHFVLAEGECYLGAGERLDALTDDLDATVIGSIELQDGFASQLGPQKLIDETQDARGLSNSRWSLK